MHAYQKPANHEWGLGQKIIDIKLDSINMAKQIFTGLEASFLSSIQSASQCLDNNLKHDNGSALDLG